MGFSEVAYLAWPWVGLGGAIVLFILLFSTDVMRSRADVGLWRDAAWLAWLPVPVYLCHVFEEYGLHVPGGRFDLVTAFMERGLWDMFGQLPLVVFPEINIMIIFVAFPIAAALGRKRPVVGLMSYGFMLVNGLTHIGGTIALGGDLLGNPGNVTGSSASSRCSYGSCTHVAGTDCFRAGVWQPPSRAAWCSTWACSRSTACASSSAGRRPSCGPRSWPSSASGSLFCSERRRAWRPTGRTAEGRLST